MKTVFLDIDNTLLDFDAYVKTSMIRGFRHFSLREYEDWMYDVFVEENTKLWRRIEEGTLVFEELNKIRWNIVFARLDIDFDGVVFEHYFQEALNESAIPVEGAYELLEALHGKYMIAAASNGPSYQQNHRLQLSGMKKYFDYIVVSEDAGASKPSREFFDYAFKVLNEGREEKITPADCLMIGDSVTSDIAGAVQYGMHACFYRRDPAKSCRIAGVHTADSLKQIASSVDEMF